MAQWLCLLLLSNWFTLIYTNRWTEADEERRIQMIMEEELRQYNAEMRPSGQARMQNEYRHSYPESGGSGRGRYQETEETPRPRHRDDRRPVAAPAREVTPAPQEGHWCYYCAAPLKAISRDSRQAVKNLLELRRTPFPTSFTRDCINGSDVSSFTKQKCQLPYCETLALIDHEKGSSWVMRGCAEHFGGSNPEIFESREDNTCERFHEVVDVRECICRHRNPCYMGREKKGRHQSKRPDGATSKLSIVSVAISIIFCALIAN